MTSVPVAAKGEDQLAPHQERDISSPQRSSSAEGEPPFSHKYLYPEFASYEGERYLNTLLQEILPYALWRTWHFAVDFQAPGKECYVGTARIAERVKPGIRKIEIDLQELAGRGLMNQYTRQVPILQKDGTFLPRMVSVKDFSALYAFAYEYHLWLNSPEYVPASREHEDFFRNNPQLMARLIKYDNYRRLFTCQKPGPKPKDNPLHLAYQCQLPQQDPEPQTRVPGTGDLSPNLYLHKQLDTPSPYRIAKKEENLLVNNSSSSAHSEKEPLTIRNISSELEHTTIETKENEKREHTFLPTEPKSKQIERTTEKETTAESVKEEKTYNIEDLKKNPMAMVAFLLEMQQFQQPQPDVQKPKKEKRQLRGTPAQLARSLTYIVQQLGENPKSIQSDITRITKIYWATTQLFTGFKNIWFLDQLQEAFLAACKARGVKRRVPYFFVCLENILQLTPDEKAFIRSDEPLYKDGKDIKDFIFQLRRTYEKSGSGLAYHEWVQENYLSK
jgi:hypothetical protein